MLRQRESIEFPSNVNSEVWAATWKTFPIYSYTIGICWVSYICSPTWHCHTVHKINVLSVVWFEYKCARWSSWPSVFRLIIRKLIILEILLIFWKVNHSHTIARLFHKPELAIFNGVYIYAVWRNTVDLRAYKVPLLVLHLSDILNLDWCGNKICLGKIGSIIAIASDLPYIILWAFWHKFYGLSNCDELIKS